MKGYLMSDPTGKRSECEEQEEAVILPLSEIMTKLNVPKGYIICDIQALRNKVIVVLEKINELAKKHKDNEYRALKPLELVREKLYRFYTMKEFQELFNLKESIWEFHMYYCSGPNRFQMLPFELDAIKNICYDDIYGCFHINMWSYSKIFVPQDGK
jgi:hypothetical protein